MTIESVMIKRKLRKRSRGRKRVGGKEQGGIDRMITKIRIKKSGMLK